MRKAHSVPALGLGLVVGLVGCMGGEARPRKTGPTCTTGKCDSVAVHPLVVSCKEDGDEVECSSPLAALLPFDATVMLWDGKDNRTLTAESTARVKVGTPVKAYVFLQAKQEGLFHQFNDSASLGQLEVPFVATGDRTFALPFDLWTVTIESTATIFDAKLDPQTISIAPWHTLNNGPSEVMRGGGPLPAVAETTETFFVLVNRDATSVSGKAQICDVTTTECTQDIAFSLDGSGGYIVENGALVRQSKAPAPSDPPADEPAPTDPGPTDPDPSCGGQSQPGCGYNQQSCDDHFVLIVGDCTACGRQDQPGCGYNQQTCDDHFVLVGGACTACGRQDQPGCGYNQQACDEGFTYELGSCRAQP